MVQCCWRKSVCPAEPSGPLHHPVYLQSSFLLSPSTLPPGGKRGMLPSHCLLHTPLPSGGFAFMWPIFCFCNFPSLLVSPSLFLLNRKEFQFPPHPHPTPQLLLGLFLSFLIKFLVSQPHAHVPPLLTGFHPTPQASRLCWAAGCSSSS